MACIAALIQITPLFLSEAFVILTMFSAIPIYIICKINPKIGVVSTIVSFLIINLLSTHEALFFICSNGPIGTALGYCSYFTSNKKIIIFVSSVILSITISIMNFIIGIPVFGTPLPGTIITQILILLIFSLVYSLIYLYLCEFIFRKIKKFVLWYEQRR